MKKLTKLLFLSLCASSLSLSGCYFNFINIATDDISPTTLKYTYNDFVNRNIAPIDGTPVSGSPKLLVVPVWFTDSISYISLLNKERVRSDIQKAYFGSNDDTGWRSVHTYYQELSQNKLNLTGVVTDWYECGYTSKSFYSSQSKTEQLVVDAVNWYKESHSMADFDSDQNGYLDGVMLIYGSPDYGTLENDNASNMWAYCFWLQNNNANKANPQPNAFFWASYDFMYGENKSSISPYHAGDTDYCNLDTHTYIHEMGHMFGLEDYYDYSKQCIPAGGFSMQDYNIGSHDPYSVMALGWAKPFVPSGDCTIELHNFQDSHELIALGVNRIDSPFDEYLLLELYTPTGLNKFDTDHQYNGRYPKGPSFTGIRLWHVDARLLECELNSDGTARALNFTSSIRSNYYYTQAMKNTYYKEGGTTNGYISPLGQEYADYNLLQLIRKSKAKNYKCNEVISSYDLFSQGDSFEISKYKDQFVNGAKTNAKYDFPWSFTIKSLNSGSAKIKIEKEGLF